MPNLDSIRHVVPDHGVRCWRVAGLRILSRRHVSGHQPDLAANNHVVDHGITGADDIEPSRAADIDSNFAGSRVGWLALSGSRRITSTLTGTSLGACAFAFDRRVAGHAGNGRRGQTTLRATTLRNRPLTSQPGIEPGRTRIWPRPTRRRQRHDSGHHHCSLLSPRPACALAGQSKASRMAQVTRTSASSCLASGCSSR